MNAIAETQRWGLTGVHDPGEPQAVLDIYEELGKAGQLNSRIYAMVGDDSAAIATGVRARAAERRCTAACSGSAASSCTPTARWARAARRCSSRTATIPATRGLLKSTPAHLQDVATRALRAGFQVCTHAIGDRGNRIALDAYEAALAAVPTADHRFRIEHAQNLYYTDIPRFAKLGVIPSMQASHQTSDMYWVGTRLGVSRLVGGVRVAVAAQHGRGDSQRQRLSGRAGEPADLVPRRRVAAGREQLAARRLVSRSSA